MNIIFYLFQELKPLDSCNILLHLLRMHLICATLHLHQISGTIFSLCFNAHGNSQPGFHFWISFAFSAKNSLRFLMMLLIHRNFKWPCTCISCMHTGQMLRYFWIFDKSISYRIHFREFIFIQFLYCLFILTMLKYIQKVFSLHLLREERYGNY